MHPTYRALIQSRVVSAHNDAIALSAVDHDGLKGHLREIVIRELFRPLMPADIGLGTGEIVSADGRTSSQQDVVFFDRGILPPLLMESAGVFPIESVLYSIEVKSRLRRSDLEQAHQSATVLEGFPYQSGTYDANDQAVTQEVGRLLSAVVAFGSDLADVTASYDEVRGAAPPLVKAICVVGTGYWYWNGRENRWTSWNVTFPFEETVAFLSGVMNTIPGVRTSRRNPRLGHYLL